jgi:Flp pilus assembly pilin Flp
MTAALSRARDVLAFLKRDRRGVTALEYAMVGAFITTLIVGAVSRVGVSVNGLFLSINGAF